MALKLKPFELPRSTVQPGRNRIQPLPWGEVSSNTGPMESPFSLGDTEKFLFSHFAAEHCRIIGTPCSFFHQEVGKSKRDPLYDEPQQRVWSRPYEIKIWVSWPSTTPLAGEEGFHYAFDARAWIPRQELERVNAPAPFEGDILKFWDAPLQKEHSIAGELNKKSGYYFDVVNADTDGHIMDTPSSVGFVCDLKRRSEFGGERRIVDP